MSVSSSTKPAPGSLASPTTSTRPSIPPLATDVKAANGRKSSPPPTPSAQAKADQTTVAKDASSKDNAKEATDAKSKLAAASAPAIDMETFKQILELDEDDTYEFSYGMAWAYFSQVKTTFEEMDEALAGKDLAKLSSLGHFLKGSSAALGVEKVQQSCTKIQHYGVLRDEEAAKDLDSKQALEMITAMLAQVKVEYEAAEKWLKNWYKEKGIEGDPE